MYLEYPRFVFLIKYTRNECIANFPNDFIISLENNLQLELSMILDEQEKHLVTKSPSMWIRDRDKNIKFYHTSTLV